MKDAILKICEKLRGYSNETEYFEVVKVNQNENGDYSVVVHPVEPQTEQGAQNESN